MGFKNNILSLLPQCQNNLSTDYEQPLARISTGDLRLVQVIDLNNTVITYTYDKFIEIYDSYGLDGFVF